MVVVVVLLVVALSVLPVVVVVVVVLLAVALSSRLGSSLSICKVSEDRYSREPASLSLRFSNTCTHMALQLDFAIMRKCAMCVPVSQETFCMVMVLRTFYFYISGPDGPDFMATFASRTAYQLMITCLLGRKSSRLSA